MALMTIKNKFIVLFFISCFIPLGLMSVLAFSSSQQVLQNLIEVELTNASVDELAHLEDFFNLNAINLNAWSQLQIMQDVLSDDEEGELAAELKHLTAQYPYFSGFLVINDDGMAVSASDESLKEYATLPLLEAAYEATSLGKSFQSNVQTLGSTSLHMLMALPIRADYDSDTVIGSFVGIIDWQQLQARFNHITIIGKHQDIHYQLILMQGDQPIYQTHADQKNQTITQLPTEVGIKEIELGNISYVSATANTKALNFVHDPNWTLHTLIATNVAYMSIHKLRNNFLVLGSIILLLAAGTGFFLARSIVKPISNIIQYVKKVANGDLDSQINHQSRDELGNLVSALRTMQTTLVSLIKQSKQLATNAQQASIAKSEFLANISHEIRTPMNSIMGFSQALSVPAISTESQKKFSSKISQASKSLLSVLNNILDLSKLESGKFELNQEPFELIDVLENLLLLFGTDCSDKGVELAYNIDPNVALSLKGDSPRLAQVLTNLIGNAVKFTPSGEIEIRVRMLENVEQNPAGLKHLEQPGIEQTLRLQFSVRDTGIGVEAMNQHKLFQSFTQADGSTSRKYGGTGLGLSISQKLVQLMGGNIRLFSHIGKGSTFTFTVDMARDDIKPIALETRETASPVNLLVLYQNEMVRQSLINKLRRMNYNPIAPGSLGDMLELLKQQSFALALVDECTVSVNDQDTLDQIKRNASCELPLIVIASQTNVEFESDTIQIIEKPVLHAALLQAMSFALKSESEEEWLIKVIGEINKNDERTVTVDATKRIEQGEISDTEAKQIAQSGVTRMNANSESYRPHIEKMAVFLHESNGEAIFCFAPLKQSLSAFPELSALLSELKNHVQQYDYDEAFSCLQNLATKMQISLDDGA